MMKRLRNLAVALACGIACVSCQSYYVVTDLRSNDKYYTHGNLWMMERRHGGLQFQEFFTGDLVELESARAHELTAQQAQELIHAHSLPASRP
jgi:hypothetical protein